MYGLRRTGAEKLTYAVTLQLLPKERDGYDNAYYDADVDVNANDVEEDEQNYQGQYGDNKLRPRRVFVIVRVQGVEFEVFASRSGLVYENVKKHDNDHDLDGRANEARDGRDACAGSQCAHGCHVGHLRAARHCQGERVRAGAQNAQNEALGNVTVRKNGKRDGIHEHNENAGVYAAHAQHYSYHQKNRYGNNVFPGVARAGFEQGRHDGLGNGIGCSAHGVDLRLYVAEQQNEEKAADGDKHAVNECTCQGVDKRQPVEKHDNGRAYYGCYIDRPVFIAEYDYYQKAEQASDYTHK